MRSIGRSKCISDGIGECDDLLDEGVLLCIGGGKSGVLKGDLEEDVLIGDTCEADELLGVVAGAALISLIHTGETVSCTGQALSIDLTVLGLQKKESRLAGEAVGVELAGEATIGAGQTLILDEVES